MKIRIIIIGIFLILTGTVCSRLPVRKTTDINCQKVLTGVLAEVPGSKDLWEFLTRGERLRLIKEMTKNPGSVGEYLNLCVDEGWLGYFKTPIPDNSEAG